LRVKESDLRVSLSAVVCGVVIKTAVGVGQNVGGGRFGLGRNKGCRCVKREMCSSDVPVGIAQAISCYQASARELRTWRGVNYEIIKIAPSDFRQELPDHPILFGTSPYDTVSPILQEEPDTHTSESPFSVGIYRDPSV
jgi:hypothetical protein